MVAMGWPAGTRPVVGARVVRVGVGAVARGYARVRARVVMERVPARPLGGAVAPRRSGPPNNMPCRDVPVRSRRNRVAVIV